MNNKHRKENSMIDKEKRELKNGVISIFKRFNLLDHTATIGGLRDDILRYIDSLQEELSKFDAAIQEGDDVHYNEDLGCRVNLSQLKRVAKKEEPVSEELGDYINELSKQFPEVSFAKLSRIAVRVAKWQKEQMIAKAIDGYVIEDIEEGNGDFLLSADYLPKSMGLKDQQRVKVIVIKKD